MPTVDFTWDEILDLITQPCERWLMEDPEMTRVHSCDWCVDGKQLNYYGRQFKKLLATR